MVEVASSNALQHNPHGAQAQLLSVVANFMNRHLYRRDLGLAEDPRFLQNRKVFGELLADQLLDDLVARGVGVYDTSTILQDSHIRCIDSSSGARDGSHEGGKVDEDCSNDMEQDGDKGRERKQELLVRQQQQQQQNEAGRLGRADARSRAVFLWRKAQADRQPQPSCLFMERVQGGRHPHLQGVLLQQRRKTLLASNEGVTARHRQILLDWHVDVGDEFHLCPETTHLAVALLDRCLSTMLVRREHLQLLGCVCLLTAAKMEEPEPHDVEEFVYISDNT